MDRLPSFSGLTAFYAAARHGTLTAAAAELNVSQPAISRRIATLEADLGCPLFDRTYKPVRITQSGKDLLRALKGGFGQIESAVAQIRQAGGGKLVTVSAPSGFVAFRLIPQLRELEAAFDDVTIRIISQEYGEPTRPGDVAIRFGFADDGDGDDLRLLGDGVFAAASPLYLSRRGMSAQDHDYARMTLLTMETARSQWHDWPSWFRSVGRDMPRGTRVLDFSSYAMLVNAALAAQGVCLCWDGVLDMFLETGSLVRLSGPSARSSRGYFMGMRDGLAADPHVRRIHDWIAENAGK